MSLDLHRRAEALMASADRFLLEGNTEDAVAAYSSAGSLELDAFRLIPRERVRTRSIIATSAITLFRRAGDLDSAISAAYEILSDLTPGEAGWSRVEALVDEIRNERSSISSGRRTTHDVFDWIFKGNAIEVGQAPIELVLEKIRQVDRLGIRVFEQLAGRPLRKKGAIPPEVRSAFRMVVSEPAAGSFAFTTRFEAASEQLDFFSNAAKLTPSTVTPDALSSQFGAVLGAVEAPDEDGLKSVVPDEQYREAFLRLLRDMAPDGDEIGTVEIRRHGGREESIVVMRTGLRRAISEQLRAGRERSTETVERTGVLRAVDLNNGWIKLGQKGEESRWDVGRALVLEDVVEGLVNKRVHVTGHQRGSRFIIDDIEAAEPEHETSRS